MKILILFILAFQLNGCGVKGTPLPPLKKSEEVQKLQP
jgi:predicted small lipoprotein YifL